ncbi:MAG: hypothetical protein IT290_03505, partial [Deltaproteobacteria bacterium]|nr:hypothetical protein [Deltaproteobacteria bacterium]
IARIDRAVTRARALAERDQNINSSLGRYFFVDSAAQRDDIQRNGLGAGQNGMLTPGNWNFTTRTFSSVGNADRGTAMKLELKHTDASPLKTIFMRILGRDTVSFRVTAIAASAPMHVVAAVDLSSFSASDNFWREATPLPDGSTAPRAEYALELSGTCATVPIQSGLDNSLANPGSGYQIGRQTALQVFEALPHVRTNLPPLVPMPMQYRDDYTLGPSCQTITRRDPSRAYGPSTRSYLLNQASVPEPLQTYLASVHRIMELMEARNAWGDQFGFLGAEDYIYNQRVVGMSRPIRSGVVNTPYEILFDATRPYDPGSGDTASAWASRVATKALFPTSRHFNLAYTMLRAREMLQVAHTPGVRDVFILFTSGMTGCGTGGCPNTTDRLWADGFYTSAMNDAALDLPRYISNPVTGAPISFNVIMGGTGDGGSTLMRRKQWVDDAGRNSYCMSDWLGRRFGHGFVDSSWDSTNSSFLFPTMALYNYASQTKGIYFPLRPCCTINGCSCMTAADVAAVDYQGKCRDAGGDLTLVNDLGNATLNRFIEGNRLICDPFGRKKAQQGFQAVSDIVGKSPIMLVTEPGT